VKNLLSLLPPIELIAPIFVQNPGLGNLIQIGKWSLTESAKLSLKVSFSSSVNLEYAFPFKALVKRSAKLNTP